MEGSNIKQGLAEFGFVIRNNEICGHLKDGRPLICVAFDHKPSFKFFSKHVLDKECCIFHYTNRWIVVNLAPLGASALRVAAKLEPQNTAEKLLGFEGVAVPSFSLDGLLHVDAISGVPYFPESLFRTRFHT